MHVVRACTCAIATCTGARIRSRDETHWRLSRAGKQPQSKQFARLIDFPWYPRFRVTGAAQRAALSNIYMETSALERTFASTSAHPIEYCRLIIRPRLRSADCKSKSPRRGIIWRIVDRIHRSDISRRIGIFLFFRWKLKMHTLSFVTKGHGGREILGRVYSVVFNGLWKI